MKVTERCPVCGQTIHILQEVGANRSDQKNTTWYRIICSDAGCEVNRWSAAAISLKEAKLFWNELCDLYNKRKEIGNGENQI